VASIKMTAFFGIGPVVSCKQTDVSEVHAVSIIRAMTDWPNG
jgi:hypothetical protein